MDKIEKKIEEFQNMNYVDFNIENLYSPANNERYNQYLINYVFKYYNDLKSINDYYVEKNLNGKNYFAGVFRNNVELSCVIPKRQTLFDEIVCIHELTHLVNELKNNISYNSEYKEIIPYFNEYHYLINIHEFFAKQYEILRLNTAIKAAKDINDDNYLESIAYINAYCALEKRKNDYNIKKLNKINSTSKDIEKKLILKGYTI